MKTINEPVPAEDIPDSDVAEDNSKIGDISTNEKITPEEKRNLNWLWIAVAVIIILIIIFIPIYNKKKRK